MVDKNKKTFENDLKKGILSKSAFENLKNDKSGYDELKINSTINKKDKYKISIIIPTHNRLSQLTKLLNSIFSQTYTNYEIIIIDDVSEDDTNSFFTNLKEDKIRYYRNPKNLGVGLNRQKGYNLSTGDFIIFCDDDDYYVDNDYLKDAIKIFEDKSINMICSSSYILYENDNLYEPFLLNFEKKIKSLEYIEKFQFELLKPTSTFPVILRKSALEEANFKDMKMMNDSSIYLRSLMIGGNTYANDKIIGVYRVHDKNYTLNVKADFTIKNLIEKKYVYKYLKKQNVGFDLKPWFEKQIDITVRYFLYGGEKSNVKRKKVLLWVLKNVSVKLYKELSTLERNRKKDERSKKRK